MQSGKKTSIVIFLYIYRPKNPVPTKVTDLIRNAAGNRSDSISRSRRRQKSCAAIENNRRYICVFEENNKAHIFALAIGVRRMYGMYTQSCFVCADFIFSLLTKNKYIGRQLEFEWDARWLCEIRMVRIMYGIGCVTSGVHVMGWDTLL